MVKFLFLSGALLLSSLGSFAQTAELPFIKLAHIGKQDRPITDLYLTTQEPALNPEQGLTGRYRFESVCLLTETEFTALLRYSEAYYTKNKPDTNTSQFGAFELTLGPSAAARKAVYARPKSLAFIEGAIQILQKQTPDPDQSEALRRLHATARRLRASAK